MGKGRRKGGEGGGEGAQTRKHEDATSESGGTARATEGAGKGRAGGEARDNTTQSPRYTVHTPYSGSSIGEKGQQKRRKERGRAGPREKQGRCMRGDAGRHRRVGWWVGGVVGRGVERRGALWRGMASCAVVRGAWRGGGGRDVVRCDVVWGAGLRRVEWH